MIIKAHHIAAMTASFFISAGHATTMEIDGMALGSNAPDLKRAMIAKDPTLEVDVVNPRMGGVGYIAHTPRDNVHYAAGPYVLGGLYDPTGKVWFVGKAQSFKDGNRPTVEATVSALQQKYGPPSGGGPTEMEWQFDRSGGLYQGPLPKGPCPAVNLSEASPLAFRFYGVVRFIAPATFIETCGAKIVAKSRHSDGMVDDLVIVAYDSASQFDRIERTKAERDAEKRTRLEDERLKGIRPQF